MNTPLSHQSQLPVGGMAVERRVAERRDPEPLSESRLEWDHRMMAYEHELRVLKTRVASLESSVRALENRIKLL